MPLSKSTIQSNYRERVDNPSGSFASFRVPAIHVDPASVPQSDETVLPKIPFSKGMEPLKVSWSIELELEETIVLSQGVKEVNAPFEALEEKYHIANVEWNLQQTMGNKGAVIVDGAHKVYVQADPYLPAIASPAPAPLSLPINTDIPKKSGTQQGPPHSFIDSPEKVTISPNPKSGAIPSSNEAPKERPQLSLDGGSPVSVDEPDQAQGSRSIGQVPNSLPVGPIPKDETSELSSGQCLIEPDTSSLDQKSRETPIQGHTPTSSSPLVYEMLPGSALPIQDPISMLDHFADVPKENAQVPAPQSGHSSPCIEPPNGSPVDLVSISGPTDTSAESCDKPTQEPASVQDKSQMPDKHEGSPTSFVDVSKEHSPSGTSLSGSWMSSAEPSTDLSTSSGDLAKGAVPNPTVVPNDAPPESPKPSDAAVSSKEAPPNKPVTSLDESMPSIAQKPGADTSPTRTIPPETTVSTPPPLTDLEPIKIDDQHIHWNLVVALAHGQKYVLSNGVYPISHEQVNAPSFVSAKIKWAIVLEDQNGEKVLCKGEKPVRDLLNQLNDCGPPAFVNHASSTATDATIPSGLSQQSHSNATTGPPPNPLDLPSRQREKHSGYTSDSGPSPTSSTSSHKPSLSINTRVKSVLSPRAVQPLYRPVIPRIRTQDLHSK